MDCYKPEAYDLVALYNKLILKKNIKPHQNNNTNNHNNNNKFREFLYIKEI